MFYVVVFCVQLERSHVELVAFVALLQGKKDEEDEVSEDDVLWSLAESVNHNPQRVKTRHCEKIRTHISILYVYI